MTPPKPLKAYSNPEFLQSREARTVRLLCEYLEPEKRFEEMDVRHTVVFFGSARIDPDREDRYGLKRYYHVAEELAYKLSRWSKTLGDDRHHFHICTGGGPGIMEAANRGAVRADMKNIGLNISLPFEQAPNRFITPGLNFEFHYFFMRKLWFLYHAKAVIVFPGGFGTLDELFETLTLIQTKKLDKGVIPVLLYDRDFWHDLINFEKLVDYGLISPEDVNLFHYFTDPDDAMDYLKPRLEKLISKVNHDFIQHDDEHLPGR